MGSLLPLVISIGFLLVGTSHASEPECPLSFLRGLMEQSSPEKALGRTVSPLQKDALHLANEELVQGILGRSHTELKNAKDVLEGIEAARQAILIRAGYTESEIKILRESQNLLPFNQAHLDNILNIDRSFYEMSTRIPSVAALRNESTLINLESIPLSQTTSNRVTDFTRRELNDIYKAIENHPVAEQKKLCKYDPTGAFGFCFGRATAVHIEALYRGIQKESIRKIWAVGDLASSNGTRWQYHVATLLRGPKNVWYAVDPVFDQVIPARAWYMQMKKTFDPKNTLLVYTSEAKRLYPMSSTPYNRELLENPNKNGYFLDLLKSFRTEGPFSGPRIFPESD